MAGSHFAILGMAAALALGGCAMQQRGPGPGPGPGAGPGGMYGGGMMHGGGGMPYGGPQGAMPGPGGMHMPGAMARLMPTQGNQATGVATFYNVRGQTMMHVRITGLPPDSEFGFHVHERGDCSAPDASSAGGHFNPTGMPHGHPQGSQRHAGDLPNLRSNAQGNAEMRGPVPGLSLAGEANSVIDRGLVIHAQPDDYKSQPAGNSGPRIACGVISQPVPPPR